MKVTKTGTLLWQITNLLKIVIRLLVKTVKCLNHRNLLQLKQQ